MDWLLVMVVSSMFAGQSPNFIPTGKTFETRAQCEESQMALNNHPFEDRTTRTAYNPWTSYMCIRIDVDAD